MAGRRLSKASLKQMQKDSVSLTREQAHAILDIKNGADVYDYSLAKTLREMERSGESKDLFEITKAMNPLPHGAKQQPYFGAIAKPKGIVLAKARLR